MNGSDLLLRSLDVGLYRFKSLEGGVDLRQFGRARDG
jgi:hypothetical protein